MYLFTRQILIHRSTYRTLTRGEYVSFDISDDDKRQALNVRGVGGTLRCDAVSQRRGRSGRRFGADGSGGDSEGFTTVNRQRRNRVRPRQVVEMVAVEDQDLLVQKMEMVNNHLRQLLLTLFRIILLSLLQLRQK